jgi:hypothetical protein
MHVHVHFSPVQSNECPSVQAHLARVEYWGSVAEWIERDNLEAEKHLERVSYVLLGARPAVPGLPRAWVPARSGLLDRVLRGLADQLIAKPSHQPSVAALAEVKAARGRYESRGAQNGVGRSTACASARSGSDGSAANVPSSAAVTAAVERSGGTASVADQVAAHTRVQNGTNGTCGDAHDPHDGSSGHGQSSSTPQRRQQREPVSADRLQCSTGLQQQQQLWLFQACQQSSGGEWCMLHDGASAASAMRLSTHAAHTAQLTRRRRDGALHRVLAPAFALQGAHGPTAAALRHTRAVHAMQLVTPSPEGVATWDLSDLFLAACSERLLCQLLAMRSAVFQVRQLQRRHVHDAAVLPDEADCSWLQPPPSWH